MTIEKFSVLLSKLSIYQQHVLRPSAFPMAMCLSLQLCYRKPHKLTWLKHSLLEILNPSAKALINWLNWLNRLNRWLALHKLYKDVSAADIFNNPFISNKARVTQNNTHVFLWRCVVDDCHHYFWDCLSDVFKNIFISLLRV